MRITIAAAAFSPHGATGNSQARAACATAARHQAELLLLPGTRWKKEDVLLLSSATPGLMICAGVVGGGAVIACGGKVLLVQPGLYTSGSQGEAIALYTHEGMTLAVLPGADAYTPQAARAAALAGACAILCPLTELRSEGPWAQAQQNGLYAIAAPSSGEARIFSPLCAEYPDGIMARGKSGSMAIARLEFAQWARGRIAYDPLSYINKTFAACIPLSAPAAESPSGAFKVAAVQREFAPEKGADGLIASMDALCAQASGEKCRLIAFPEYNWLDAYGSMPPYASRNEKLSRHYAEAEVLLDDANGDDVKAFFPELPSIKPLPLWLHTIIRLGAKRVERTACTATKRLAMKYNITIHGGSFIEKNKKKIYSTSIVALPDGTLIRQRKLQLTPFERLMGITPGDELAAIPLDGSLCFSAAGSDSAFFEPFLAARRVGCDIAITPMCEKKPYYAPDAERGAWARAKECAMFTISPAMTGQLFGKMFTGYAQINSPFEQNGGVLVRSAGPVGNEMIIAELDFEELRKIRSGKVETNYAFETELCRMYRGDSPLI